MTEKRFKHNGSLIFENGKVLNTLEVVDLLNTFNDENEQLKHDATVLIQANQDYRRENEKLKLLLQDMGLLMSDKEVVDIRNDIADKLIKPLLKGNGFDVDVDTNDGFVIIPKGDDLNG